VAFSAEGEGRELPLEDALIELDFSGFGGFISCIPGRLGYFMDEWDRYVLERPE
jgi:hypothetical protein